MKRSLIAVITATALVAPGIAAAGIGNPLDVTGTWAMSSKCSVILLTGLPLSSKAEGTATFLIDEFGQLAADFEVEMGSPATRGSEPEGLCGFAIADGDKPGSGLVGLSSEGPGGTVSDPDTGTSIVLRGKVDADKGVLKGNVHVVNPPGAPTPFVALCKIKLKRISADTPTMDPALIEACVQE